MREVAISIERLSKSFKRDSGDIKVLSELDLEIELGDFVAVMGPSGSGKSTLLHLIAAMDKLDAGTIRVLGQNPHLLSDAAAARWRNRHIGFIFQSFNLVQVLTALENVELPLKLTELSKKQRLDHAANALNLVGMGDRLHHLPRQLSGGQEQRIAIARAIVTDPDVILADEPTGNLDAASAEDCLTLLSECNRKLKKTIVMVTHDPKAANCARTVLHLEKGALLEQELLLAQ